MRINEVFKRGRSLEINKPYIIAEAGVNHEGDFDLARRLIEEAKEGGAHAIKFQTYKAEKIASVEATAYWDQTKEKANSQFELFKRYDKFWKSEYESLKKICDEFDIEFLSTPFDLESLGFLSDLMPVIKISSSDITNRPFIEAIAEKGKPILLSTGASYISEIDQALEWIEPSGVPVSLLHCILEYPTPNNHAHLAMIKDLIRRFPDQIIGYSDHTLPEDMKVMEMATLLGAQIIEKHFTHDKTLPGNDHYHAMDKEDLKKFWANWKRVEELLGDFKKRPLETESGARKNARRSLVIDKPIQKGDVIQKESLTFKRPASGVSPEFIETVVGQKARVDLKEDQVLKWEHIE